MADGVKRIRTTDLTALLKVSLALNESLDLDVVLQTAIDGAIEVLGLDTGAIYLAEDHLLHLGATTPALPQKVAEAMRSAPVADHPHIERAMRLLDVVFVEDAREADLSPQERVVAEARQLRSVLYVPLVFKGKAIGVIIVGALRVLRDFSEEDVDLCRTLAAQISLAVSNARLFEDAELAAAELRCAYDATLEGWSLALELRDEQTSGHTERAAALAVELAEVLGIPEAQLAHVRRGALLHDIGKMAVPDAILRKPGALNDAEWAIMRRHPEYAHKFLSQIEYLEPALDIPYYHHERWNGTGYPMGLKGDQIPLPARIFAVIDVYDALTSDRPYRKAWSHEQALGHIQLQAGIHFDPQVVEAFMRRVGPRGH